MMTSRRDFLKIAPASAASAWLWGNRKGQAAPIRNEFFAMDTAMVVKLGTLLERADIEDVASLGYRGIGPVAENAAAWQHLSAPPIGSAKRHLSPVAKHENRGLGCRSNPSPPFAALPVRRRSASAAPGD